MNLTLIPLLTQIKKPAINIKHFMNVIKNLSKNSVLDLIILPETSFTGYLYQKEDLVQFAEPVTGKTTKKMANIAKELKTGICFGFIEKSSNKIYNSVVLLDRNGKINLVQRKISEKAPYSGGEKINVVQTEFGKIAVLICGDLFDYNAVKQIPSDTELLIIPMSRSFDKQSPDNARWNKEERKEYQKAIRDIGVFSVIVNALDIGIEE